LNEKRIEQVLEIEKQALAIHEAALKEAEQIPIMAEKEALALVENARREAEEKARQIEANAEPKEECDRIMAQAIDSARETTELGMSNFDRAVSYVLNRVIGKE
jgi:vacuolar-type H+-ATPase subunit E/Vma4